MYNIIVEIAKREKKYLKKKKKSEECREIQNFFENKMTIYIII